MFQTSDASESDGINMIDFIITYKYRIQYEHQVED